MNNMDSLLIESILENERAKYIGDVFATSVRGSGVYLLFRGN